MIKHISTIGKSILILWIVSFVERYSLQSPLFGVSFGRGSLYTCSSCGEQESKFCLFYENSIIV